MQSSAGAERFRQLVTVQNSARPLRHVSGDHAGHIFSNADLVTFVVSVCLSPLLTLATASDLQPSYTGLSTMSRTMPAVKSLPVAVRMPALLYSRASARAALPAATC
ncbi:hypothetical protein AOB60_11385 [Streptomyces noursei]|uniref:Uncharacterized protein n=1 Tax=Streptomyces noursei TaxID=1971 RepID=A0A2N8PJY1_STRNR|nr:hypothetical protein AOB60_11385 [Streptomyces noursei]